MTGRRTRVPVGDGSEPWHGSLNGYNRHGCGCDRCRAAMTGWTRDRAARLRVEAGGSAEVLQRTPRLPVGDGTERWHGSVTGYGYHRCGCERCRKANTERVLKYKDRRKAQKGCQGIVYNSNCKCPNCREGKRAYWAARQKAVKAGAAEVARHGSGGYRQGCRCDVCRAAVRDRARAARRR